MGLVDVRGSVKQSISLATVHDQREADQPMHLTAAVVVSHNVSVRNRDPLGTVNALLASDADILMLQESDGTVRPYLERLTARFPYHTPCPRRCSLAISH